MSLVLAGLVFIATVIWSALVFWADAISDTTGLNGTTAHWWFLAGTALAALIGATHWVGV